MKSKDQIKLEIRDYIFRHFPAARQHAVRDEDSLLERGIVDSLGVLDIVAHLESVFEITIPDEELEVDDFDSIESLACFVQRKLGCPSSN